jgi:hypothetical protein
MTAHPRHCDACRGSGWADGTAIIETVDGRPHRYDTVTPCSRDWWHQADLGWDPYYDEPIPWDDPRARNAYDHGYQLGRIELAAIGPPGTDDG